MAESHFFMTREDSAEFVSFVIERFAAEFVPERSLNPPPFPRYKSLTAVQARIDQDTGYSRFAVLSAQWEEFPLVVDEVHANDGQHFHSVSQIYGGPAFDFISSRTWREGERRWMVSGSFNDYPHYNVDKAFLADYSQVRTFARPSAMMEAHKMVRGYLRRNGCRSVCREKGHPGPWILPGALREFQLGMWLRAGDFHYQPKR